MDNKNIIEEFFAAFGRRDGQAMARHYHTDLVFEDPVFGKLSRSEAAAMWDMLCSRGKDLHIELRSADADQTKGRAQWDAKYTFKKTGKFVHNQVRSEFVFRDGLIVEQRDDFNFWRWASMALGSSGRLLGWTPLVKNAVRKEARRSLQHHRAAAEKQAAPAE